MNRDPKKPYNELPVLPHPQLGGCYHRLFDYHQDRFAPPFEKQHEIDEKDAIPATHDGGNTAEVQGRSPEDEPADYESVQGIRG